MACGEGEFGGDHVGFAAPEHPAAQVVAARAGGEDPAPQLGIDVGTPAAVDAAHTPRPGGAGSRSSTARSDEPWGIRRFFVRDPTGAVVSVLAHREDDG